LHYLNVIAGDLMGKKIPGTWQYQVPDEKKGFL